MTAVPPSASAPVILFVGHGSPRAPTNAGFIALGERLGRRLGVRVLPTFFSIARPSIEDRLAEVAAEGVRQVLLAPYFLYNGQHVTHDIPELLAQCREKFPSVAVEMLPTLENEPALEDLLVDRLLPRVLGREPLPVTGAAIEARSYEIIARQLGPALPEDPAARAIVSRVTHATADCSFARTLRLHPEAVARGRAALAAGRPVLCDVKMLQAGITRSRGAVLCAIGEPAVREQAQARGCTRAAAAMDFFGAQLDGAIVAVGNAPTALWRLMEIARAGGPRPALVVGLPVGFVGALESKLALIESGLCYITNVSPRGGSPVAAAVVNALALQTEPAAGAPGNGSES